MEWARGIGSKVLVILLLLLAAVVVANLIFNVQNLQIPVAPGRPVQPEGGQPAVEGVRVNGQVLALVMVVVSLLVLGSAVILYAKYAPRRGKFPFAELVPLIVGLAVFMAVAFMDPQQAFPEQEEEEEDGGVIPGTGDGGQGEESTDVQILPPLPFAGLGPPLLMGALILIGLAALLALMRTFKGLRVPPTFMSLADEEIRREAAKSLGGGVYRLRLGDDLRSVILGCYRDLLRLYEGRGMRLRPELTAREVERAAREYLGLSTGSSRSLRSLFELARYSDHPLSDDDRRAAISALDGVRVELEA